MSEAAPNGAAGADTAATVPERSADFEEGEPCTARDFVVLGSGGELNPDYLVGRWTLPVTKAIAAVVSVTLCDGKVLVCLPEAVWNRTPIRRLLPAKALSKPLLVEVAACHPEEREVQLPSTYIKAWFGLLHKDLEGEIDYLGADPIDYDFSEEEHIPLASALLEVAQQHFAYETAAESLPGEEVPVCPPAGDQESRIRQLEASLGQIQANLNILVGGMQQQQQPEFMQPKPKAGSQVRRKEAEGKGRPQPTRGAAGAPAHQEVPTIPGLDPEAVQAALGAGVPLVHLQEMGKVLKGKPKRLTELPREFQTGRKKTGPLSESEEEEAEEEGEEPAQPGSSGSGEAGGPVERAILELTTIAKQLTSGKNKKEKFESLLDSGGGSAQSSEGGTGSSSRKNSAVVRALQKHLVEDPKYIYNTLEANVQSDFLARPVQPGEPMTGGSTVRGWLTSRSRIPLYHNHVRWTWQVAGIWDALIAGKVDEARARCGLLVAAADQASIDGGNWVVSNVALLEPPPPFQAFSSHQPPGPLELQHSALYDPRWAEVFLGHLKEVDSYVDAKKKLSGAGKNQGKDPEEGPAAKRKPKAKAKGEEKGKKSSTSEGGGAAA